MTKKETTDLVVSTNEIMDQLDQSFPTENSYTRVLFPRLSMASQDKTEGKGKSLKVVTEAGTFFTECATDELGEDGKKIWNKTELGTSFSGVILYKRYQLRFYDESTELFTSSPVYDNNDEILPLFCNKKETAKGTPAELKALYEYTDKDGKIKSRLEENRILYVLFDDQVYQLTLRGSSMYSYMKYEREIGGNPSKFVTTFSSEYQEKGQIRWNKMTFATERALKEKELTDILSKQREIIAGVQQEKSFYKNARKESSQFDQTVKELAQG